MPCLCLLQFEAFARGFMMLCGGPAIHLFSATELERLVCGNPLLDFDAMQANARYDGGYSPEHRVSLTAVCHSLIHMVTYCCGCLASILLFTHHAHSCTVTACSSGNDLSQLRNGA